MKVAILHRVVHEGVLLLDRREVLGCLHGWNHQLIQKMSHTHREGGIMTQQREALVGVAPALFIRKHFGREGENKVRRRSRRHLPAFLWAATQPTRKAPVPSEGRPSSLCRNERPVPHRLAFIPASKFLSFCAADYSFCRFSFSILH